MALLSVIRRWHFREHLSIREICRRTGLSRNTIRKYLRAGGVEPKFKVPVLRGNQDETRATIWMRFLGRGRDQVITLIAADKFFVIF